jgi:hypothetical protein
MPSKSSPSPKTPFPVGLFLTALMLAVAGWAGVTAVILMTLPFLLPRWLFFFSLFLALAGTAMPVVWYLNRRFAAERFPAEGVLVREALEAAALGVFLVWLQAGRMFTPFLGWVFFGALLAVELLLRIYENSRWTPILPDATAQPTHEADPESGDADFTPK